MPFINGRIHRPLVILDGISYLNKGLVILLGDLIKFLKYMPLLIHDLNLGCTEWGDRDG